jgi:hypothetical protein
MLEIYPEDALVKSLSGRACSGTFESHITVEPLDTPGRERFRNVCTILGVKPVLIEMLAGNSPSQPMTAAYHRGTGRSAALEVAAAAKRLRAEGFAISRVKLEAVATNEGVPETDDAAAAEPPGCYFEFHIKLVLPEEADLEALRTVCERFAARLSRNAFKQHADGRTERFVTFRLYRMGRQSAFARMDELTAALAASGFEVAHRNREYTLFDSHVALDAGWIDVPPEGGT